MSKAIGVFVFIVLSCTSAFSQVNPSCLNAQIKQSHLDICAGDSVHLESTGDSLWWFGVPGYDSLYAKEIIFIPASSLTISTRTNLAHAGNGIINGDFAMGDTFFQSHMNKTEGCAHHSRRVCTWNNFCLPNANSTVDITTGVMSLDSQFINFYFNTSIDPATNVLWSQSIIVEPFGNYAFSYWFRNLAKGMGFVQVTINGQEIIRHHISLPNDTANEEWKKISATWKALDTAIAIIEFRLVDDGCFWDLGIPCGSLFGLDGMELSGEYFCRDEINILVNHPPQKPVIQSRNDTLFVSYDPIVDDYEWYCNDSLLIAITGEFCRPSINGNYRVIALSGSCESISDQFTYINLGRNEILGQEPIIIYPNPANTVLWIKVKKDGRSIPTIKLYDLDGRFIRLLYTNQSQDISLLDPGLYIIEINGLDEGISYRKLLVE